MLRTSKSGNDKRAVERNFVEGEKVFARNYSSVGKKWLPGKVISVAQRSGLVIHRHFDQIRKRTVDEPPVEPTSECDSEAYTYISVNQLFLRLYQVLRLQQLNSHHTIEGIPLE